MQGFKGPRKDISPIWPFGDMLDGITEILNICKLILGFINICSFWQIKLLPPYTPQTSKKHHLRMVDSTKNQTG
jgi:hypothetical protein